MSTGKRLAKRSILGTRVGALRQDGRYYPAIIQSTRQLQFGQNIYTVLFDDDKVIADLSDRHLVGSGFVSVTSLRLSPGQNCFVTLNGREVSASVVSHVSDDVQVSVAGQTDVCVLKKIDEVRILESRKSARLNDGLDGNTKIPDYSRLVDGEKASKGLQKLTPSIEVPGCRKRRPSESSDEKGVDVLDDCSAAMVLMSLSCSPRESESYVSGSSSSWQPSPTYSFSDEGIDVDDNDESTSTRAKGTPYQCTWPGCGCTCEQLFLMQRHVRTTHIGDDASDDEEDFYYTEMGEAQTGQPIEANSWSFPSATRRHEDHDYQRQETTAINIPGSAKLHSPNKQIRVSPKSYPSAKAGHHGQISPLHKRKGRGDMKKCRKVYGMDNRELWCTQCKWKKACTRFSD